eukprot:gnl/MRDRNA2_/MRDRNA2_30494_c0_seq1.p1 gnl/MRDRNA2_/MRDRNA2_30494_c0~~gnl/MRDRNA2_/MRDRNA2_30494_c0_seq1.p1  ORF type:complete len:454 (+),score=78.23 gnl/MRDRNA2_/MRDRNA2_30494_c0_seq1:89-1450(+)
MELLEAACVVTDILGRGDEKAEEIQRLRSTVKCIYQATQSFAQHRSSEELQEVLNSNEVFKELLVHVRKCEDTLKKHTRPAVDDGDDELNARTLTGEEIAENTSSSSTSRFVAKVRQVQEFGKEFTREVGEALGSKLGVLREVLRLPEDELKSLKSLGSELERLVPLLNLAITSMNQRPSDPGFTPTPSSNSSTRTRPLTDGSRTMSFGALSNMSEPSSENGTSPDPPTKVARGENHTDVHSLDVDVPRWRLQLLSEKGGAPELQEIVVADLRQSDEKPLTPMSRVVGRMEVHAKLPKTMTHPPTRGQEPQPLWKFISRNHLLWKLKTPPEPKPVPDSLDGPTLNMPGSQEEDIGCDTLVMTGVSESQQGGSEDRALVGSIQPLNPGGVHLYERREAGNVWKWIPRGSEQHVFTGDHIALVLECNGVLGCQRNVNSSDATCVLGMEVRSPLQN